ncbi:MAG TPA: putative molybdenum carrier protein [Gammaproteobacteria bacterium]|nr:putative molybdenum carrier protein [Gammaproteobacteria bacterium]
MLRKIVSGGQTGVDRAALDAAISSELEYGGWCPKGRLDEQGKIPEKYKKLKEISGEFKTEKENYDARTRKNILESDGTLILVPQIPLPTNIKDGTILTIAYAKQKPYLIIDLSQSIHLNSELIFNWIAENKIHTLNIAGPRESTCPGIHQSSLKLLQIVLPRCGNSCSLKGFKNF